MIVNKINEYLSSKDLTIDEHIASQVGWLATWTFKRQFMQDNQSSNTISLSQAGKCARQLAYRYHDFEQAGKELDSRAKIIFWQGDLVETMIMKLARLAGCNVMATGLEQIKCYVPIIKKIPFADDETLQIAGHPDGILLDDATCLVECKSMSSYSFRDFEKGKVDEGYLSQMNMYMHGLGLNKCVLIAMNKDNGIMNEKVIERNDDIIEAGIKNLTTVLNSTPDALPDGWYQPDAKGLYAWQCLYCSWWKTCKPNAERVLIGKSYKLKEVRK